MNDDPSVSRRTVLSAGAVGAGAVVLAACGSGSGSGSRSGSPAGNPPANAPLAKLDDIEIGKSVSAQLPDGGPAIVARLSADSAVAFSAVCTHQGCTVAP